VIWNPTQTQIIQESDIFFKHKISPYIAQNLSGVVLETIVNGQTVYQNQTIQNKNKGQWHLRK